MNREPWKYVVKYVSGHTDESQKTAHHIAPSLWRDLSGFIEQPPVEDATDIMTRKLLYDLRSWEPSRQNTVADSQENHKSEAGLGREQQSGGVLTPRSQQSVRSKQLFCPEVTENSLLSAPEPFVPEKYAYPGADEDHNWLLGSDGTWLIPVEKKYLQGRWPTQQALVRPPTSTGYSRRHATEDPREAAERPFLRF
eukprot:946911-Rhodomonas_salina.2